MLFKFINLNINMIGVPINKTTKTKKEGNDKRQDMFMINKAKLEPDRKSSLLINNPISKKTLVLFILLRLQNKTFSF